MFFTKFSSGNIFIGFVMTMIALMVYIVIVGTIGAYLWPYTVNTWLKYAGKKPALSSNMGFVFALVPAVGWVCLPGAVITYIAMLFLQGEDA